MWRKSGDAVTWPSLVTREIGNVTRLPVALHKPMPSIVGVGPRVPLATTTIDNLPGLLALLTEAAQEAGALALSFFREGRKTTAAVHSKLGGSPVTDADYAVDRLLHRRLTNALPNCGWLSEETVDSPERLGRHDVLVVDPIDGTRAFAAGLTTWAVSIAVVSGNRPVAGVVYAPALDKLYAATAEAPATCNDRPIAVASRAQLGGARVAGPQNFVGPIAARGGLTFVEKVPSLACRFAFLAEGLLDVAIATSNAHDWDVAAVDLILQQAGGLMTTGDGAKLAYNRAVPRHPPLFGSGTSLHPQVLGLLEPPAPLSAAARPVRVACLVSHVLRSPSCRTPPSGPPQLLHLVFGGELTKPRRYGVPRPVEDRRRRHLSGFRVRAARLARRRAIERRQRDGALLHRASAPLSRSRLRQAAGARRLSLRRDDRCAGAIEAGARSREPRSRASIFGSSAPPTASRSSRRLPRSDRARTPRHRRHVARAAFHDPLCLAAGRADCGADLPSQGCRAQRHAAAAARACRRSEDPAGGPRRCGGAAA